MRKIILVPLLILATSVGAQTVPPPYNGQPDIRMDTGNQNKKYIPPPYWTVWFTTTSCEDGYDYQSMTSWVQSYNDSATAYRYSRKIIKTGKVLIWNKMKCIVDTSSVYIDRYDMVKRKYDHS